jgi:tRNA pseudouridine55 synthase
VNGLLVVDKEVAMTSHDVVARCRRILGVRRVGHAGTLDPGATGVLVVGVGQATRLLRYLGDLDKEYRADVVFGTTTTSLDADGEVVAQFDMAGLRSEDVDRAARSLTGEILQVPPMVSAIKVGGQRLHALARRGESVERAPRQVRVERFELHQTDDPLVYRADVRCSSGTYVRVLAADVGERLDGGAHLANLRRTRVGRFVETDACTLSELEARVAERGAASVLLPARRAVDHLEVVTLDALAAQAVSHGRPLVRDDVEVSGPGPFALVDGEGTLRAVYEERPDGRIGAAVVLGSVGSSCPDTPTV